MGSNHKKLFGLFLILFGLYYFLKSLGIFTETGVYAWPFMLLILSGAFHIAFFLGGCKKEKAGLLVPGGVLLVLGLLFIFETAADWNYAGSTWPVYLLAAAFGLFELWLFGGRERGLLIPICVLSAVGAFFFAEHFLSFRGSFWPLAAIIIGLYYVFRKTNPENLKNKSSLLKETKGNREERMNTMSQSKKQEERQWKDHKQAQHPHGEVKSLKELSEETDKDSKRS